MELTNKFILSVFISTFFFTEALCLSRKLIGHEPIAHAGKKFSLGQESTVHAGKKFGIDIGIGINIHGPLTIDSICAKTDYAPLCINSLRAKVHGPIDPLALLRAEIEATDEKVKSAQTHLAQLELKPDVSRDSIRICKENYRFAIDSLEKAKLAIETHDLGSINSELSAVTTYASTCDDTFAESPGETSPLALDDEEVSHLGSNCLAITDLIKW